MADLIIREHPSKHYSPRTYYNAMSADLTIAIALYYYTAGEKLTKKAAGDYYLALPIREDAIVNARTLYKECKKNNVKYLNVAGNGIYTLQEAGWDQLAVNAYVYSILALVHKHHPIEKVYSGLQTGVDLAGAVAAYKLGIGFEGTTPKGFIQRGFDGIDREMSEAQIRNDIIRYSEVLT